MLLLSLAPSTWFSLTTDEPSSGPKYLELCNGSKVMENGVIGYVIDGYGSEPFDGRWFVEMGEVGVVEAERFEYA